MARVGKNSILSGLSGKVGNQLVLQKNGVVRSLPDPAKLKWTDTQKKHRSRFERAKQFGRAIEANPELKAIYKLRAKKGTGAYQVAISAYMRLPGIDKNPYQISELDS